MAAAGTKKQLKDILTCCLCCELYTTQAKVPKALPCLHTFCATCLDMCCQKADENCQEHTCPVCKTNFEIPPGGACDLPTNYLAQDIIELNLFHEQSSDKRSKLCEYPKCKQHQNKESVFICMDCCIGLCAECIKSLSNGAHCQHTIEQTGTVLADLQVEVDTLEERCNVLPAAITKTHEELKTNLLAKQKDLCKQLTKNAKAAHLQVCAEQCKLSKPTKEDKHVNVVHQQVRDWQMETKDSIKEQSQSHCLLLDTKMNNIMQQCKDTKQEMENIKALFSSDVLACVKQMQNHFCNLKELEWQCQELRQNSENWDAAVSTKCQIDMSEHTSIQKHCASGSRSGFPVSSASSSSCAHISGITSNSQTDLATRNNSTIDDVHHIALCETESEIVALPCNQGLVRGVTNQVPCQQNTSSMRTFEESSQPDEIQTVQNDHPENHARRQNKQITKAKPQELFMSTSTGNIRHIKKRGREKKPRREGCSINWKKNKRLFKPRIRQAEVPPFESILLYFLTVLLLMVLVIIFGAITHEQARH